MTLFLIAALAALPQVRAASHGSPWIWGVTLADPKDVAAARDSLAGLPQRATARLVFDPDRPLSRYQKMVTELGRVSDLMGQVLDSTDIARTSVPGYRDRAKDLLTTFGDRIPLWEIGNEVNGEWTGKPAEVADKIGLAYDEARAAGKRTALTFYYDAGCVDNPQNEMFTWIDRFTPPRVKAVDYVFISYYEDDCPGTAPNWQHVFLQLTEFFPGAELGFGEVGTKDPANKESYLRRYYGMKVPIDGFVGGYFWWQGADDFVPHTKPLWKILSELIGS